MSEEMWTVIGCIAFPIFIIIGIVKLIKVFKITKSNSEVTVCQFTEVYRIRYLFITYWIYYTFKYDAGDRTFIKKIGLPSIIHITEDDLNNGVEVRYLKDDPSQVEFAMYGKGIRVFGWLIFIAGMAAAGIFCYAMALDL